MTGGQFEKLAVALALIHGELQAIRQACERSEAIMRKHDVAVDTDEQNAGTDITPANAAAVLMAPDDEAPPCPALPMKVYQPAPRPAHRRPKGGGRK